jgi:hypothetical protein
MLGSPGFTTPQRDDDPHAALMGMIGFDIACMPTRSGSRIHGYLVNDPWKTISANSKRTDFALAA